MLCQKYQPENSQRFVFERAARLFLGLSSRGICHLSQQAGFVVCADVSFSFIMQFVVSEIHKLRKAMLIRACATLVQSASTEGDALVTETYGCVHRGPHPASVSRPAAHRQANHHMNYPLSITSGLYTSGDCVFACLLAKYSVKGFES